METTKVVIQVPKGKYCHGCRWFSDGFGRSPHCLLFGDKTGDYDNSSRLYVDDDGAALKLGICKKGGEKHSP